MLGIPTVLDRVIAQAILQVLVPIFAPDVSERSYGFRAGRSAHHALEQSCRDMADGYRWVVNLDLEKFFDSVHHDLVMSRVARKVKDKRLLKVIRHYLKAGSMQEGVVSQREAGMPQGSPLSPLWSNSLLDELDKELERRGHRFCRYADDANVDVRSKRAGLRVMASVTRFVAGRLRLKVNRAKSVVERPWNCTCLGYTGTNNRQPRLKPAPKSVQRAKDRMRQITHRGRGRNIRVGIEEINRFTRGVFHGFLPPNPREGCHSIHTKPATQSTRRLPLNPRESCHPNQALGAFVGATRRRVVHAYAIGTLLVNLLASLARDSPASWAAC